MKPLNKGKRVRMMVSGQKVTGRIIRVIDTGVGYRYDVTFSRMVYATGGPYVGCITTQENFIN